MNKYWFKPKSYGWGFVPVTWEGWLATLILVIFVVLAATADGIYSEIPPEPKEIIRFILDLCFISAIMLLLFERKMEEPLRWRWGSK